MAPQERHEATMIEYAREHNQMSCNFESSVPEACLKEKCWMGIDEAGEWGQRRRVRAHWGSGAAPAQAGGRCAGR